MSKQSSVEWLIEQIEFDANERCFSQSEWFAIFQRAKAMHKEEVEQYGAMCCLRTTQKNQWSLEGLYKETFGGQDNE